MGRRAFTLGALGGLLARATPAFALARTPVGGSVTLRVPWPLASVDPHRADDAAAAIFGEAMFDALYAFEGDAVVPALAESPPEATKGGARVALRAGLSTALGRGIGTRDVVHSLARAKRSGARAWLADVPVPRRQGEAALFFPSADPGKLARALASPLTAIVPMAFAPERPDGTGPFRAQRRGGGLALSRNPRAALGPSFLDTLTVHAASDLADSLRSFEAGTDDMGWLGSGLHEPRAGSRPFDAGAVGWALLRTGRLVGAWDAPGTAQRLCDGIAPSRLSYLALGPAWRTDPDQGWGGAPCDLLVRDDAPWLVEVARAVAATLSRASHEVTPRPVPWRELAARRASRAFTLAVDFARPFAPGLLGTLAGLATADNPASAVDAVRHPPRIGSLPPRTLTRTMRVGVLGEVRVQGGRVPDLTLPPSGLGYGIDWGSAFRSKR